MRRTVVSVLVLVATMFPLSRASAQKLERLEFVNATVRAQGQTSVPGMAFRAHLSGGNLDEGWSVVPAIEYWRFRFEHTGVSASARDFTLGVDARYRFPLAKAWHPYAG